MRSTERQAEARMSAVAKVEHCRFQICGDGPCKVPARWIGEAVVRASCENA